MASFINIQAIFDKPYEFNLIRENLTWQQLSTVIQTSIVEAADKEPLSLYYSSNSEINTLSNENEFSQLLLTKDILGLRLYGQSQENMEPVHILPNDAFKRLSEFVQHHDLESDLRLSKMVGILAARIVYSPHKNFDDDFIFLENMPKEPMSKHRKLMKSRKMLWKHRQHRKLHKKMAHHRKHASPLDNEGTFEFLSHHPSKGLHRHGRRGFHHRHPSGGSLHDIVDLTCDDDSSSETGNNEHIQDKYAESDASLSSQSDSESESENEQEEGTRFGRRGGHGGRFGRHGGHGGHFGRHGHHPSGPAELHGRFGNGRHHGRHGRHHLGGRGGRGGPGIGGPGVHGPKFGGKLGRRHHHDHREELNGPGFEAMHRHFGPRGHHHGRKHQGEKLFLFA
jgi:hypothetical protein